MPVTKGGSGKPDKDSVLDQLPDSGGGGGGGNYVYYGTTTEWRGSGRPGVDEFKRRKVPLWLTEKDASNDFSAWSHKKRMDLVAAMQVGGLIAADDGILEAFKKWEELVKMSARLGRQNQKVSPWDLLGSYVEAAGGTGGRWVRQGDFEVNSATGERRYVGPQFKTVTNTRVDMTDPATAKAIATKLFQDMLGRDPAPGELSTFATALGTAEKDNPITETVTTEFDKVSGDPIGSTSTAEGGMTAEGRAYIGEQQIKKGKEYGAFQAGTYLQNAFEQAVYGAPE